MTLNAKKLQELKMAQRRRERRPVPSVIIDHTPLKIGKGELARITQRCPRLLLAVESTLVQCAAEQSSVDDSIVAKALECSIRGRRTSRTPCRS